MPIQIQVRSSSGLSIPPDAEIEHTFEENDIRIVQALRFFSEPHPDDPSSQSASFETSLVVSRDDAESEECREWFNDFYFNLLGFAVSQNQSLSDYLVPDEYLSIWAKLGCPRPKTLDLEDFSPEIFVQMIDIADRLQIDFTDKQQAIAKIKLVGLNHG